MKFIFITQRSFSSSTEVKELLNSINIGSLSK